MDKDRSGKQYGAARIDDRAMVGRRLNRDMTVLCVLGWGLITAEAAAQPTAPGTATPGVDPSVQPPPPAPPIAKEAAPAEAIHQPATVPSTPAAGDPAPSSENDTEKDVNLAALLNMTVVTISRRAQRLSDAPAAVYVIDAEDIRQRGYVNLADIFRDIPGFDPSYNAFSEMGSYLSVRGQSGNNKIVVLVNGMRVNPPGGEDMMFRSDFSIRAAKQIEISYGPGSTLYGQDAIFAVVNVITKRPENGHHFTVSGGFGARSYKDGYALAQSTLGSDGKTRVTAYAQFIDASLSDLSVHYPRWWNALHRAAPNLGGATPVRHDRGFNGFFRIENDTSSLQFWYRNSSRSSSEGSYGGTLKFTDEAVWHDLSFAAEAQNRLSLHEKIDAVSTLTFNSYEVDPESRYVWPLNSNTLFLNDYKYARGQSVTLEERLDLKLTANLSVMLGAVATTYDVIPKATIPGGANTKIDIVSQGGSLEYYTEANNPASLQRVQRASNLVYQNYGAFGEAQWHPIKQVHLIAGVRVDNNSRFDAIPISPRLAAIYQPNENLAIKYIFTQAFVAPPPYFGYNVFANANAVNILNPNLEPERATSNEVNTSYTQKQYMAGLSLFYNRMNNLFTTAVAVPPGNTQVFLDPAGMLPRRLNHSANGGRTESYGVDLYSRASFGMISPWVSVSYVNTRATTASGTKIGLNLLSHVNVRLGAAVRILDKLTFTPSLVLRSNLEWADEATRAVQTAFLGNEVKLPYELNAHLMYTPVEGLDLYVTGRNLTNHKYATKGISGPTPQEPIMVMGGVRYTY